jgi:hypothetical protein
LEDFISKACESRKFSRTFVIIKRGNFIIDLKVIRNGEVSRNSTHNQDKNKSFINRRRFQNYGGNKKQGKIIPNTIK